MTQKQTLGLEKYANTVVITPGGAKRYIATNKIKVSTYYPDNIYMDGILIYDSEMDKWAEIIKKL